MVCGQDLINICGRNCLSGTGTRCLRGVVGFLRFMRCSGPRLFDSVCGLLHQAERLRLEVWFLHLCPGPARSPLPPHNCPSSAPHLPCEWFQDPKGGTQAPQSPKSPHLPLGRQVADPPFTAILWERRSFGFFAQQSTLHTSRHHASRLSLLGCSYVTSSDQAA